MMARLILYVANHRCAVRFTHAEGPIAALPCEGAPLRPALLDPSRRICFDNPHAISEREIGRQSSQKMHMILGSSDCNWNGFQFAQNAANVCMHIGSARVGEEWGTAGS